MSTSLAGPSGSESDAATAEAPASRPLRVVVWNANMAVHRKLPELAARLSPDVAIVPECADPATLRAKGGAALPDFSMEWVGRSANKGLAVFGFGDYTVSLSETYDDRLEWVMPIDVDGPVEFALLSVWAHNRRAKVQHPDHLGIPQSASALTVYRDWLAGRPVLFAGDFNHSCVWDSPGGGRRNHASTVALAESMGLFSAYHRWSGDHQGFEATPTMYWKSRSVDGPKYHIDYVFVPEAWEAGLVDVHVGAHAEWVACGLSDHVPIVVDFELPLQSLPSAPLVLPEPLD